MNSNNDSNHIARFTQPHHQNVESRLEEIAGYSKEKLKEIGISETTRDKLLECIIPSENPEECWSWSGAYNGQGNSRRPALTVNGRPCIAARVVLALVMGKPLDRLNYALHCCPGKENGQCMNPRHLYEGNAKDNADDRSHYRKLNGAPPPSERFIERRPRGRENPKSFFKGLEGVHKIQGLRATWDAYSEKEGLLAALARYVGCSSETVGRLSDGNAITTCLMTQLRLLTLGYSKSITVRIQPKNEKTGPRGINAREAEFRWKQGDGMLRSIIG